MKTEFTHFDDVVVVYLPPDLFDQLAIVNTDDELLEYVNRHQPLKIVVSFDRVAKCGSEAVGRLVEVNRHVREYGGKVKLCSLNEIVYKVFEICDLIGRVFEVYPTTSDAVRSFAT